MMNERKEPEPTALARRERDVMHSVESLFRRCDQADNPALAYSRACSKVGYLARDGVRSELHYLESALNERKHALVMERCGQPEKAKEHHRDCGRDLRSFQRAVRAEIAHPRPPLSTPKLRDRIHDNLEAGQWTRAGRDLDDLMRRPDIGKPLPALDTYSRSGNLDERQFAAMQSRIEQCNVIALERDRTLGARRPAADRSGIPAETMDYFRRSNATFERAFGTTRESIQSEVRAHLARDGFTPDRRGRGGLGR